MNVRGEGAAIPATRMQRGRSFIRTNLPWRRLMGRRVVRRSIQGVELYLPWMHPLPDFTRGRSRYGLNLVDLARLLAEEDGHGGEPMRVVDIGANIGDSAAQILAVADTRILCVDGDPYWVEFLRRNLGDDARVEIEEALLLPTEEETVTVNSVRSPGTTRFTESVDGSAVRALPVSALPNLHMRFESVRLIKSDTDGFDPVLVPALAKAWAHCLPVLFFEYHPALARATGDDDPGALWDKLADLDYNHLAVWDNGGDALGSLHIEEAREAATSLEPVPKRFGYDYWDVAACRSEDSAARVVLDNMMPGRFSPAGPVPAAGPTAATNGSS